MRTCDHNTSNPVQLRVGWLTTLQLAAEHFAKVLGPCTGSWQYHSANGHPVMAVLRFDGTEGKQYRPLHMDEGKWAVGDPCAPLPLYRLPDVIKAERVYICEGEKAADAGRKMDLVCTTSAHGAAAPLKSYWSVLAGKEVIILPDHDEPGMKYAQTVAGVLLALKPPAKVKIVELPGLKAGEDLVEWMEAVKAFDWKEQRGFIEAYAADVDWLQPGQVTVKAQPTPDESGPVLVNLADVQSEDIKWLWEGKLALGKLAGWAGAPGDGKSIASMDVAARITTGAAWPDKGNAVAGSVLLITAEDGLADTIRPRLDAAGADVSKVHHFAMVRRVVNGRTFQELFTLGKVRELEKTLNSLPDCRLVIIDPVGSFFGATVDSNGDAAVRSVLAPIAALAEARNVAVLLIMHTRKESGERADDAVMGSRAFTGIVRSMWHIRRDDNDSERRLFLPGKNNSIKAISGLAYRVVDGNPGAKVEWEANPVEMTADQAVRKTRAMEGEASPDISPRQIAGEWLERLLESGPRPAGNPKSEEAQPGTLLQEAREAGLAWRTVQRAAAEIGVMRARSPRGTMWLLNSMTE